MRQKIVFLKGFDVELIYVQGPILVKCCGYLDIIFSS